jgi:GT2 family glycosyltransferase
VRATASVVIPAHNRAPLTRQCLETLLRSPQERAALQPIVVDDASTDDTPDVLEEFGDRINIVRHDTNTGFAQSCNDGAAAARGDWLVFLNNDTLPTGPWLDTLLGYAESRPHVAVVGAKLLFRDGTVQHAGVVFSQKLTPHHLYAGFPGDHPAVNKSRPFQTVTAACALLRRSVFEQEGGFDPTFVNGYEDTDLFFRFRRAGHEVHYCHKSSVYHLESVSRVYGADDRNHELFMARWGDFARPDDVAHYVSDGLIALQYMHEYPLRLSVSPLLATFAGERRTATERLLAERSRAVFEARRENTELRADLADARNELAVLRGDAPPARMHFPLLDSGPPKRARADATATTLQIEEKIAPLRLEVTTRATPSVDLLVPTVDFRYFFGGYITKFAVAQALAAQGLRVRVVLVDETPFQPAIWREQLSRYDAFPDLLDRIELVAAFDRSLPLPVHPDSCLIATTWWTAHIAQRASEALGRDWFLYLIQEYEPFTFPMGSFAALARETYHFPHWALFSTELLRDYFSEHRLGVFERAAAETQHAAFRNAITDVGEVAHADVALRAPRRLLFYARPEAHAARNMFELGVLALERSIETGALGPDWELTGIGSTAEQTTITLRGGRPLRLLPRLDIGAYRDVLRSHDVGLALMYTPHPSLVPIEMASAAMAVVTNTFENKTGEALAAISPNIVGVEPTIEAIAKALAAADERARDYESRVRGADVHWPRSWDDALAPVLPLVKAYIQATSPSLLNKLDRH